MEGVFFLKKTRKRSQNVHQRSVMESRSHITISQSSARILCGEEPEGAETVGTKPKMAMINRCQLNNRALKGTVRNKKLEVNLTNLKSSHCLLSLSPKVCNM